MASILLLPQRTNSRMSLGVLATDALMKAWSIRRQSRICVAIRLATLNPQLYIRNSSRPCFSCRQGSGPQRARRASATAVERRAAAVEWLETGPPIAQEELASWAAPTLCPACKGFTSVQPHKYHNALKREVAPTGLPGASGASRPAGASKGLQSALGALGLHAVSGASQNLRQLSVRELVEAWVARALQRTQNLICYTATSRVLRVAVVARALTAAQADLRAFQALSCLRCPLLVRFVFQGPGFRFHVVLPYASGRL